MILWLRRLLLRADLREIEQREADALRLLLDAPGERMRLRHRLAEMGQ